MTSFKEKFTSNENKALIWSLLQDSGVFSNIPDKQEGIVQNEFENVVRECITSITSGDDLMKLNKKVIAHMVQTLEKYKNSSPTPNREKNYTQAKIQEERQSVFQSNLDKRQEDFSNMINASTPQTIDFSDKTDEPLGDNIDKLLNDAISMRENQLHQVLHTQDPDKAETWIGTNNDRHIKIGESIEPEISPSNIKDGSKKQVRFQEQEGKFLNKLKTVDANIDAFPISFDVQEVDNQDYKILLSIVKEVLENQKHIMDALEQLTKK